jgi:hypothetical protein
MPSLKEPKVPFKLHQIQKWFAEIITQPIKEELQSYNNDFISVAARYLSPSEQLRPHERMEIYQHQYWWRLLNVMHENFPFVTRLFGYTQFNHHLGIRYLAQESPTHWALCRLGESFPLWVENHYFHSDKELVYLAALVDWALGKAFWISETPPVDFINIPFSEIVNKTLFLRASLTLFALEADLFSFRNALVRENVDYWDSHPFPKLRAEKGWFIVFRTLENQVSWQPISLAEYKMLSLFKEGLTINDACEKIEVEGGEFYEQAKILIPLWFRNWTIHGWLTNYKAE